MRLARKKSTPALIRANRANALKSTGPVNPAGKKNSSLNGLKHGLYARHFRPYLAQLGEDPTGYEELRQGLRSSLGPEGTLEEILVDQLAELRWNQQRLLRAEDARLADRRRKLEIEQEQRAASESKGTADSAAKLIMRSNGMAAVPDSNYKFDLILGLLWDARARVEISGFDENVLASLRFIYGPEPGFVGGGLISGCERGLAEQEEQDEMAREANRRSFLADTGNEIASYQKLQAIYRETHLSISPAAKDAALIPEGAELKSILRLERRVERGFHTKLEEWFGCQRAKRQAGAFEVISDAAGKSARPALPPCAPAPSSGGPEAGVAEENA